MEPNFNLAIRSQLRQGRIAYENPAAGGISLITRLTLVVLSDSFISIGKAERQIIHKHPVWFSRIG